FLFKFSMLENVRSAPEFPWSNSCTAKSLSMTLLRLPFLPPSQRSASHQHLQHFLEPLFYHPNHHTIPSPTTTSRSRLFRVNNTPLHITRKRPYSAYGLEWQKYRS
ncbi:hypothetical protein JI435_406340, partial [Parastagonospora nodorum SN15]